MLLVVWWVLFVVLVFGVCCFGWCLLRMGCCFLFVDVCVALFVSCFFLFVVVSVFLFCCEFVVCVLLFVVCCVLVVVQRSLPSLCCVLCMLPLCVVVCVLPLSVYDSFCNGLLCII